MNKYTTDEDFIDVTESGNKLIIFAFLILIIGISIFGYYFVFQKMHFSLRTVSVEIGSELSTDVNDYLKQKVVDTTGYKLNTKYVKTDEIGVYTYTVTYNKSTKSSKIKVVDTTPPQYTLKEMTIEENDDYYLGSFLEICEDYSKPCLVSLKNDSDESKFKTVGTYDINIVISDIYNNKVEDTARLNVVASGTLVREEELDLTFTKSSEELPDFNDEYYLKFDKAYSKDSEEFEDIVENIDITLIEDYLKNNYPSYSIKEIKIVSMYNKSEYIMGVVIKVTLNLDGVDKVIYYQKSIEE